MNKHKKKNFIFCPFWLSIGQYNYYWEGLQRPICSGLIFWSTLKCSNNFVTASYIWALVERCTASGTFRASKQIYIFWKIKTCVLAWTVTRIYFCRLITVSPTRNVPSAHTPTVNAIQTASMYHSAENLPQDVEDLLFVPTDILIILHYSACVSTSKAVVSCVIIATRCNKLQAFKRVRKYSWGCNYCSVLQPMTAFHGVTW